MLEDSMLGGSDDDIDDLLEDCIVQVDGPPLLQRGHSGRVPGEGNSSTDVGTGSSCSTSNPVVGVRGDLTVAIQALVEPLIQQSKMMVEAVRESRRMDDDLGGKRKMREDISYYPQEPVMLLESSYKIQDDAHDTLDLRLRQRLRPINVCPTTYYKKGAFERVERPIHGFNLYTEHLMPVTVNEGTVCKMHDRWAYWEIKNLMTSNAGVVKEPNKKIKVQDVGVDKFYMGVETEWKNARYVWEVVEAGFNYMAVEFMIRNYSYTALAMMRTLHECRYFCGVAPNPKTQRHLLEGFFNECFKV